MLQILYGGTFDPVHNGHLAIARSAHEVFGIPVHLMPAADPPHRARPGANAVQRAHLLDLAAQDQPGLRVDRRELRRAARDPSARSYTVDTLREWRAEHGDKAPLALLVGADSLLGLPTWRAWHDLFDLAHFIVADRPGSGLDAGLAPELSAALEGRWTDRPSELHGVPAGRVYRLHQPLHSESATEIRRRIGAGEAWRDLVPPRVADAIADERLYASQAADSGPL